MRNAWQKNSRDRSCQNPSNALLGHYLPGFSFRAVDQFLTGDAISNPWNRFQALGIDLLLAVQASPERALTDPFQRGIDGT